MQCLPYLIQRKSHEGPLRKQIASHKPRPIDAFATFRFSLSANNTELRIFFESIRLANGRTHCVYVRVFGCEMSKTRRTLGKYLPNSYAKQTIGHREIRRGEQVCGAQTVEPSREKCARFAESINQTVCNPSPNEWRGMSHFFRSRALFKPERNSIYRLWALRKNASACTAQILSEQIEHVMEAGERARREIVCRRESQKEPEKRELPEHRSARFA